MKKLIFRKFIKDNIKLLSSIIFSIGSIVWILQSVNLLDFVTEDGHSLKVYFLFSLLNFPKIFSKILPFVFFISLFYQIVKYEANNELLTYWIHGVKKIQLINIIILYSFIISFFQLILSAYIAPKAMDEARSFIRSSNMDFFPSIITEGKFVDAVEGLTIFIQKKDKSGNYQNIYLKTDEEKSKTFNSSKIIFAKTAVLLNNGSERYFKLFDGKLIKVQNRKINIIKFESIDFDLSKFTTKSTTFPKIQEVNIKILIKCVIYQYKKELNKFKDQQTLGCNERSIKPIKEEILKRLYMPIYIPLIAVIACFLTLVAKENKNYNIYKLSVFIIIFITIIISEISLTYSNYNIISLLFFLLFPVLSLIILYSYLTLCKKL